MSSKAFEQPISLRLLSGGFLTFWCVIASFPLLWIAVMSFKLPLDAFADNPLDVMFGPETLSEGKGLSLVDIIVLIGVFTAAILIAVKKVGPFARKLADQTGLLLGWAIAIGLYALGVVVTLWVILPFLFSTVTPIFGSPILGATLEHYYAVWVENEFYNNFLNSLMVTAGVVTVSLTVGTLAGFALARSGGNWAFWLLIAALVFRALPHSVLVTGYLPVFINSSEILAPIFGEGAPTLYGQPWAVIAVLVSINQPFTIWMLRSFFMNIPKELDEAARVDGCTHLQAFVKVIMPVMWPGVITTGLFSFLLAYNDYLVTALLLDAQNQTMVPAITSYFNRETTTTDQIEAVAAAVSITAPLFLLIMVFQRQIVSGLTAGAVKG